MPVFKDELKGATEQLIIIKNIANGKVKGLPPEAQQAAQAIYQKYGPAIDNLIEIGLKYTQNKPPSSLEIKSSKAKEFYLNMAGKTLAILGIGRILTGKKGLEEIKDAWNAPADILNAKQNAIKYYNNAVERLQNDYINIGKDFVMIVESIINDDATKLVKALNNLEKNSKLFQVSLENLDGAMKELDFNNANIKYAINIFNEFLTQVGLTIATMGATSAATSVASKSLTKFAPKVTAGLKLLDGVRKLRSAHKFYEGVKATYEISHAIGNLEERLKKNQEAYRDNAPKIAALN